MATPPPDIGDLVRLAPGPAEVIETVFSGRLFVDGRLMLEADDPVLRARRKLMHDGAVMVTVMLDAAGRLIGRPQIAAPGVFDREADANDIEAMRDAIVKDVANLPKRKRDDDKALTERLRRTVRGRVRERRGKRPLIDVHVVRA